MSTEGTSHSPEPAGPGSDPALARVLALLQETRHKGWVEVVSAVVLSLATVASAWCVYQSKQWDDVETDSNVSAGIAAQQATEKRLYAGEVRGAEAALVERIVEARGAGDHRLAGFLSDRLFPDTRAAVDAWWAADPMNNPAAPRTPFLMSQYRQPDLEEARELDRRVAELHRAAQTASRNSSRYVLLTVLLASVMFFAGIGGTFDSPKVRRALLAVSCVLLLVTLVAMARTATAGG